MPRWNPISHLRRVLVAICVVATVWAAAVALTGGFFVRLGSIRVSSRGHLAATLTAVLSGLAVWVLSSRGGRGTLREEWAWWKRLLLAVSPAVMIVLVGIGLEVDQWAAGRPLWLDEEMIALNVRDRSLADLDGPLWLGQSAPFGWLVIQRAVMLTLGSGELALRLVPMLFGIATLVTALWIGRRWLNPVGAAVLVLLCSFGLWLSHYPLEVKHYSGDAFWGLLLPALAVWAIEAPDSTSRSRRTAIWWASASVGHWLANGALLVTPACAAFLFAALWRRDGRRAAQTFAQVGLVWFVSFGLHYHLSLRHTHNSQFLRSYWTAELPPASVGLADTARWLLDRLEPLAANPAGTGLWVSLWLLAVCGFVFSSRPLVGLVFAAVPLSAFAFAALSLVPLHQRFSLWIVPALYAGVALVVDRAVRLGGEAYGRRSWMRLAACTAVGLAAFYLCADIFARGREDLAHARPPEHKHNLDDRAAVPWLMRQRQPGDAVLTTRLGWPALWWYGGIAIDDVNRAAGRFSDGGVMYQMAHVGGEADCRRDQLADALRDHRRVLVYLGFRDVPDGFKDLLLLSLDRIGVMTTFSDFTELSFAAVIDLHGPSAEEITFPALTGRALGARGRLDGCVGVRLARRW